MTRTALITGASSGIGEAFADAFAASGFDLVITARREDRLRALAARLEQQHGRRVHVIPADLADPGAVERLCGEIAARGIAVDALVNNAGFGVPGAYVKSTWPQHDLFLQVMVVAVAELTHRLLPGMIERRYGRIVNVASLAGLVPPTAGHTLYAASKAFLIRFSEALAQEVEHQGVHVRSTSVNTAPNPLTVAGMFVPGTKKNTSIRLLPMPLKSRCGEKVANCAG